MDPGGIHRGSPFLEEAERLLDQGHFERARRLAEDQIARFPSDFESRIVLCKALLGMSDLDTALGCIREIDVWIRLAAEVYSRAGDAFAREGRLDEAARLYGKHFHLCPGDPGEVPAARMRAADAQEEDETGQEGRYDDVEAVDPSFWTVTLADLYLRQGHPAMAREVLEEILRRDPIHEEARARLAALPASAEGTGGAARRRVVTELSRWLRNIERLGVHGE